MTLNLQFLCRHTLNHLSRVCNDDNYSKNIYKESWFPLCHKSIIVLATIIESTGSVIHNHRECSVATYNLKCYIFIFKKLK